MPLPTPANRRHLHTRNISFAGYEREDGLFDIEAHMTDTKTYAFNNDWRGAVTPGMALHEMRVRVTVDEHFLVHEVQAVTENSPFAICPDIAPAYAALKGLTMGPGWRQGIRERVGGVAGCTHITELLYPMATVAFQTITPLRRHRDRSADAGSNPFGKKPAVLNTCHAWGQNSSVVKKYASAYYTGADSEAQSAIVKSD